MFTVSEFLSDKRQLLRLSDKVSASVDVVSGVTNGRALGLLLFILYTSELFDVDGKHICGLTLRRQNPCLLAGPQLLFAIKVISLLVVLSLRR